MTDSTYYPVSLEMRLLHLCAPELPLDAQNLDGVWSKSWKHCLYGCAKRLAERSAGWVFIDLSGYLFAWGGADSIDGFKTIPANYLPYPEWLRPVFITKMEQLVRYVRAHVSEGLLLVARPGSVIPRMNMPVIDIHRYHCEDLEDMEQLVSDLCALSFVYHYDVLDIDNPEYHPDTTETDNTTDEETGGDDNADC